MEEKTKCRRTQPVAETPEDITSASVLIIRIGSEKKFLYSNMPGPHERPLDCTLLVLGSVQAQVGRDGGVRDR